MLKLSRGTSVILLITYLVYLLFQLKSHSYLYQGTPQHIIDRETEPGILQRMDSSSTSSSSSSSSISNSTGSRRRVSKRLRAKLGRKRQERTEIEESIDENGITEVKDGKGKERSATPTSIPKSKTDPARLQTPPTSTQPEEKPSRPGLGAKDYLYTGSSCLQIFDRRGSDGLSRVSNAAYAICAKQGGSLDGRTSTNGT